MMRQQELPQTHLRIPPRILTTAALLLALLACGPRHLVEEPIPAAPEELRRWSELSKSGRGHLLFNRFEQAEQDFEAAFELSREYRPSDVRRRSSLGNLERLAKAYLEAGRPQDFARVMERLLKAAPEVPTSQTGTLAGGLLVFGRIRRSQGELEVAREALELALSIYNRTVGETDMGAAQIRLELGLIFIDSDELDRAEQELADARAIIEESVGREHPAFAEALIAVAKLREAQQRGDEAEAELRRAVEIDRATASPSRSATANAMVELGRFYWRNGRTDDAEATLKEMVAMQREANERTIPYAQALNELAWFYVETGRAGEGESSARTALEILDSLKAAGPSRGAVLDTLATSLRNQDLYPESEKLYLQAIEETRSGAGTGKVVEDIADHYGELLRQQGREAEIDHLLEELRNPSSDSGSGPGKDGSPVGATPGGAEAEPRGEL